MSTEQGRRIVGLARATLDSFVERGEFRKALTNEPFLSEKRGVFVTLNLAEEGRESLRGCVGFPYPAKPIGEAVQEATVAASSEDPRFPRVQPAELDKIVVEVSILTIPVALDVQPRQELPSKVRIGEDGLMVSTAFASGLLLPQVATEYGMDAEEFLSHACMKAGIPSDSWLQPFTKIQTFQADIFAEKAPRGAVARVALRVS